MCIDNYWLSSRLKPVAACYESGALDVHIVLTGDYIFDHNLCKHARSQGGSNGLRLPPTGRGVRERIKGRAMASRSGNMSIKGKDTVALNK